VSGECVVCGCLLSVGWLVNTMQRGVVFAKRQNVSNFVESMFTQTSKQASKQTNKQTNKYSSFIVFSLKLNEFIEFEWRL
jgi:hypothetical protein